MVVHRGGVDITKAPGILRALVILVAAVAHKNLEDLLKDLEIQQKDLVTQAEPRKGLATQPMVTVGVGPVIMGDKDK